MSPHKITSLPLQSSLALFDVSHNGFLPKKDPLHRLPHAYYTPWETLIVDLPSLIVQRELRPRIDEMPILHTGFLITEAEWQRAYSVLAYLAQGYIWQGDQPSDRLPPSVAVPFLEVSKHVETQPVGAYAAYNLWNWAPTESGADICQPDNLRALHTLTGTDDESWFLMVSNAMEARAGRLIKVMSEAIEAIEYQSIVTIMSGLETFRREVLEIAQLLERMDERCDPQVFYHEIRPRLAGSMNMAAAGLPNGVFYDEGDGRGEWRRFRGGSNGQSSLVQFFDVVLGVDHVGSASFHQEMRDYMPGPHARFLENLEAAPSIRQFVTENPDEIELTLAYDAAVAALSSFRDKHIQLVTRYIILPSRNPARGRSEVRNLAVTSTEKSRSGHSAELVGTGGTKLVPFLRQSRDETSAMVIGQL